MYTYSVATLISRYAIAVATCVHYYTYIGCYQHIPGEAIGLLSLLQYNTTTRYTYI